MSLIDDFERQKKKTLVFNGIRNVRAGRREKERLEYQWLGRLSPSKLSLDMCVWRFYQEKVHQADQLKDRDGVVREDWNYFGYDGTSKHKEFQEDLRQLNLKRDKVELWKGIDPDYAAKYLPEEKRDKFQNECIEVPIFYEWNNLTISAYVDHILNIPKMSKHPIIGDFKTPHQKHTNWPNWTKQNLPKLKDFTQVSVYLWFFNQFPEILGSAPEINSLQYYNNYMCGDIDAEREFYFKPPIDLIHEFLLEHNKEKTNWDEKRDSSCSNRWCTEHWNDKFDLREYLI